MTEEKKLVCIVCPMGCSITVLHDGDNIEQISGFSCNRGQEYAKAECIHPVRTVTSTVSLLNGQLPVAPVKTDKPIPKHLILDCIREINRQRLQAPVRIGDVVIHNVLGTGANIVVTGNIPMVDEAPAGCCVKGKSS